MCYLKNINTLKENNFIILKQIVRETQNGMNILAGPVVLESLIKICKNCLAY